MQVARTTLVIGVVLIAAGCAGYVHIQNQPEPKGPPVVVTEDGPAHPAHLGIPPGHLPPPGQCRIWIPGRPPGHQPQAGECRALRAEVPVGAWLVYRPSSDRKHVEVTVYDLERPRVVVAVRVYDADSGRLVR
jgi:hypothetical protein